MSKTLEGERLELPEDHPTTMFRALLDARDRHGGDTEIIEDALFGAMSYTALLRASLALAKRVSRDTERGERVGVFLPTGVPAAIVFFALQAGGRTPAFFNYGQDAETLAAACDVSGVKRIISSTRFVEAGDLEDRENALSDCAAITHLEDLREDLTILEKAAGAIAEKIPQLEPDPADPEAPAVILFTSGTTGAPKGVALSHANILANIAQVRAHIEFDPDWVFFSPMPVFHSLGLTGGLLLPILTGRKAVLHHDPLERKGVPKRIRESGANVLVATDAFARLYAKAAGDALETLEFVVLGGERVDESTREALADACSAEVIEGYGLSEASPIVAVNQPGNNRPGTVGRLAPGMEARLEEVEGVDVGERLLIRGPNLMVGQLDPDEDGALSPLEGDWFDTGDLATCDADGFITITGRVKRFAKIGGEMVSLDRVVKEARALWSDADHAVLAVRRDDGGEAVVLVTDEEEAGRDAFSAHVEERDLDRRLVPKHVLVVEQTPMTPTGSPDYPRIRELVHRELELEPAT
ncbi:MAG: AMP-binding protein [Oceanicaulis sp.]